MALKNMFDKLKELNDPEKIKTFRVFKGGTFKGFYNEIKEMGLKKFWQTNNKVFKIGGLILIALIIYGEFRNSQFYQNITGDPNWSYGYFFGSLLAFTTTVGVAISWYISTGFRDKYTTSEIDRSKMKYKGVDWHKFDDQLKKEGE